MEPDLDAPATKRDLLVLELATKHELLELEERLDAKLGTFKDELMLSLAGEIARSANVVIEHMTSRFRAGDDRTTAVGERLDAHLADASVHRVTRRRAR